MANGTALPPWLSFDPFTRTLSGDPASFDTGDFDTKITATDVAGAAVSDILRLNVTANPPVCTLSATPPTVRRNGTSILTATCIPAASTDSWTGDPCTGTSASSCTVSPRAATTYTVTVTNYSGPGAPASDTYSDAVAGQNTRLSARLRLQETSHRQRGSAVGQEH
ncbi:MAG: putative Ig domain-containing protein [Comamonadaceae bacterium]|nr:putative Ig domain-containing protein [Comamonadaceae bacterium]